MEKISQLYHHYKNVLLYLVVMVILPIGICQAKTASVPNLTTEPAILTVYQMDTNSPVAIYSETNRETPVASPESLSEIITQALNPITITSIVPIPATPATNPNSILPNNQRTDVHQHITQSHRNIHRIQTVSYPSLAAEPATLKIYQMDIANSVATYGEALRKIQALPSKPFSTTHQVSDSMPMALSAITLTTSAPVIPTIINYRDHGHTYQAKTISYPSLSAKPVALTLYQVDANSSVIAHSESTQETTISSPEPLSEIVPQVPNPIPITIVTSAPVAPATANHRKYNNSNIYQVKTTSYPNFTAEPATLTVRQMDTANSTIHNGMGHKKSISLLKLFFKTITSNPIAIASSAVASVNSIPITSIATNHRNQHNIYQTETASYPSLSAKPVALMVRQVDANSSIVTHNRNTQEILASPPEPLSEIAPQVPNPIPITIVTSTPVAPATEYNTNHKNSDIRQVKTTSYPNFTAEPATLTVRQMDTANSLTTYNGTSQENPVPSPEMSPKAIPHVPNPIPMSPPTAVPVAPVPAVPATVNQLEPVNKSGILPNDREADIRQRIARNRSRRSSLMWSADEFKRINAAVNAFKNNSSYERTDEFSENPQEQKEDSQDTILYTVYLSSLIYISPTNWTIWLNNKKISTEDANDQEFKIIEINDDFATIRWKISSLKWNLILNQGQGGNLDDMPMNYDRIGEDVIKIFTLRPNQTYIPISEEVMEGKQTRSHTLRPQANAPDNDQLPDMIDMVPPSQMEPLSNMPPF